MKRTRQLTFTTTGKDAADLLMNGVYVRRVGVTPADHNLYLTVRHLYDRESTILRNVWTGAERICAWDEIEFA
jgi:hypothetical protein